MTEMTRRERILAASRGELPDRLPFFHYWRHSQIGWAERECRNRGMGMSWMRPCYTQRMHGVEVSERPVKVGDRSLTRITYTTPVGEVYQDEFREPGTGQWHGSRSWRDISPWQTSRLIKGPDDYAVMQYIVEHTEYVADDFPIEQAMDWLGDEGIVMAGLPHSPMQTLLIDWIGSEEGRCFYHLADYPDLVEGLYQALCRSREPLDAIAARCPAPVVLCGDNLDGQLVNPRLFERYFMPVYERQAQALHAQGKLMAVHMDGRVGILKERIAATPIDIIEALHPAPMGDMTLREALAAWPNKAIWVGFPGAIYALGPEATRAYALQLLEESGSGERVVIVMSTEELVSNENLLAVTSVLEHARLPLTPERLTEIEKAMAR